MQAKYGKSIEEMKRSDVEAYIAGLVLRKEKGEIAQSYINNIACVIKVFAKWLKKEGKLSPDEFCYIEEDLNSLPKEVGEDSRVALSDEEKQQVRSKIVLPLHKQLNWTGDNFGLRRQEYSNALIKHLELDREDPRLKIELSKGHKTRYIPLFPKQVSEWKKWLNFLTAMDLPHKHLFFNLKNPGKPLNDKGVCDEFGRISKITGIHIYTQRLRYTYAVKLWKHGVDIFVISKLLGHNNVETTMRYLKVREEEFYRKFKEQAKGLFD